MPTPEDRYAGRRERLREDLRRRELTAGLVTRLVNVRYLTGFTGSNAALVVASDGQDLFATDGRYVDQAGDEVPDLERLTTRTLVSDLVERLLSRVAGPVRLGAETHDLSVDAHWQLTEQLADRFPGNQVESLDRAVERLRVRKDSAEADAVRTACQISCAALEDLLAGPLVSRSERELARDLEWRMFEHGAEAVGFDTILASGPNSAIPHHRPTGRVVERGDLLKVDFGARYAGYHADCTRTMSMGTPASWQTEIYALVAAAQSTGIAALRSGAELSEVDEAARSVIARAGHGDHFTHGLGHGVGLEIHEDPFFAATSTGKLAADTPVTVEPGIYLPGRGGVRIEDTLLVGADDAELLTTTTKELLAVG